MESELHNENGISDSTSHVNMDETSRRRKRRISSQQLATAEDKKKFK